MTRALTDLPQIPASDVKTRGWRGVVLAGVNGAGKSSIGGHLLTRGGQTWFKPDPLARELVAITGCNQETANGGRKRWSRPSSPCPEGLAERQQTGYNRPC